MDEREWIAPKTEGEAMLRPMCLGLFGWLAARYETDIAHAALAAVAHAAAREGRGPLSPLGAWEECGEAAAW